MLGTDIVDRRRASDSTATTCEVPLPVERVIAGEAIIAAALLVAYLVVKMLALATGRPFLLGLVPMFDLDAEANLPSFFQAQGLILVGLAVLVTAANERSAGTAQAARWLALALAFFYIGADEAAMIHDRLGYAYIQLTGQPPDHADWVLPMAVICGLFGLWMAPFLWTLPRATFLDFSLAAVVYVSGAVGFELVGKAIALRQGYESVAYVLSVAAEEGLEMAGIILFLRAALLHMRRHGYAVRIEIAGSEPTWRR